MSGPEEPPEGERPPDPQQGAAYPPGPAYPQGPGHQGWPYQQPQPGIRPGPLIGGLAIGFVVGFFASFAAAIVGAAFYDGVGGSGDAFLVLPQLLPLGLSVFLLVFKRTRMAGAGLVMGIAIGAIVMPGVCVALFSGGSL